MELPNYRQSPIALDKASGRVTETKSAVRDWTGRLDQRQKKSSAALITNIAQNSLAS
jgi:late competence protein required for DNA uptake (superfamily II DNA/RNA helicase)